MKNQIMLRAFILSMIIVIELSCAETQNPLVGLWYYIDKNSVYWEEVYTDSLFWVYSDEVGTTVRPYKFDGKVITQTYQSGRVYAEYKIAELLSDRIVFTIDGEPGILRKIRNKYDFKSIIKGDSIKFQKYLRDYRKRKYRWESQIKK